MTMRKRKRSMWWQWTGESHLSGPTPPLWSSNALTSTSTNTTTLPSNPLRNGWRRRAAARHRGRAAGAGAGARNRRARTTTSAGLTMCWRGSGETSWRWASWFWGTRSQQWPTMKKRRRWWSWRRRRSSSWRSESRRGSCWQRKMNWGRGAESWSRGCSSSGLHINICSVVLVSSLQVLKLKIMTDVTWMQHAARGARCSSVIRFSVFYLFLFLLTILI